MHDDVTKWKNFPRYWLFVQGIHRSPVNSPHKGQWRWALVFSLICAWINDWVNTRKAGDLRRHCAHHDVIVMDNPKYSRHAWKHIVVDSKNIFCYDRWMNKQRVLMHGHQGWNVRHGLCHIYMIYVYIWVVYSFCLFCCLFIIVTTQFVALYKPCKPKPKLQLLCPPELDRHLTLCLTKYLNYLSWM